jgi:hypothetical protein
VARIARDLTVSPGELRSLARKGAGAADLLYRRMDDLGLDRDLIARGETSVLRDMQRACSLCAHKGRCRHDLANSAEPSAWHLYCPNDDTLAAFVAGGAQRIRRSSTSARAIALEDDGPFAWALGLLLVALAWLALLAVPPPNQHGELRRLAPLQAVAAPTSAVDCLDAGCLSVPQRSALRDLHALQTQGWIASSADEIASLPRIATLAQDVQAGEELTCRRGGGTTYYGLMFQSGCNAGVSEVARLEGFMGCRPMAGGGVCLMK